MNILQYDLDKYSLHDVEEAVVYLNSHGLKSRGYSKRF